jgi:hypothetical protein
MCRLSAVGAFLSLGFVDFPRRGFYGTVFSQTQYWRGMATVRA